MNSFVGGKTKAIQQRIKNNMEKLLISWVKASYDIEILGFQLKESMKIVYPTPSDAQSKEARDLINQCIMEAIFNDEEIEFMNNIEDITYERNLSETEKQQRTKKKYLQKKLNKYYNNLIKMVYADNLKDPNTDLERFEKSEENKKKAVEKPFKARKKRKFNDDNDTNDGNVFNNIIIEF
jgi:hypothetical protein